MKKVLFSLLVLFIVVSSVSALDASFGIFTSDWEIPKKVGQTVSVSYVPFSYDDFDFGVKADLFMGILKPEKRTNRQPGIHFVFSLKALVDYNIDNLTIYGGAGIFSNTADLNDGSWGTDTELGLKYNIYKNLSVGASVSGEWNVKTHNNDHITPAAKNLYHIGRAFISYKFLNN